MEMNAIYALFPRQTGYVGVELINEKDVLIEGKYINPIAHGRRGFDHVKRDVELDFLHRKKLGRNPSDLDAFETMWLISEPCAEFLQRWCPASLDFRPGTVRFEDGSAARNMWLCDVILQIDAIDYDKSGLEFADTRRRFLKVAGKYNIDFKDDRTQGMRIFRDSRVPACVYCDKDTRVECKRLGLKGFVFTWRWRFDDEPVR